MTTENAAGSEKLAYSVEELAGGVVPVGKSTVYKAIRTKRLAAKKIGRRTVVTRESVAAWLHSLPNMGTQAAA